MKTLAELSREATNKIMDHFLTVETEELPSSAEIRNIITQVFTDYSKVNRKIELHPPPCCHYNYGGSHRCEDDQYCLACDVCKADKASGEVGKGLEG